MHRSVEGLTQKSVTRTTFIPQELFWPLLIGLSYLYSAVASLSLYRQEQDTPLFWFSNAIALFILLSRPLANWPTLLLTTALASLGAQLFALGDSASALIPLPAHLSEILVGALLLKRYCRPAPCVTQVEQFLRALLCGSLIPAAIGAGLFALMPATQGGVVPASPWLYWFAGHAIGSAAILPLGVLLLARGSNPLRALLKQPYTLLAITAVWALAGQASLQLDNAFIYISATLMLVAISGQFAGTAVTVLGCTLLLGRLISTGTLPHSSATGVDLLISFYPALVLTLLPPILLSCVLEQLNLASSRLTCDVTESRELAEKMAYMAHHDALTDLPNRMLFADRLAHACAAGQRRNHRFAVVFMDLDHFKRVNDSLGHGSGDKLLCEVARRLTSTLRASDTVCRLGGDEFVLLLEDVDSGEQAIRIVRKIVDSLSAPGRLDDLELVITASFGIALYPQDGQDADSLMKHADAAMYRSKRDGRNCIHLFSREDDDTALARLQLENDIRHGIQNREFVLHYQPIVDAESRRIVSVEALVRWYRPGQGFISPDHFIPVAEESGLILPLGEQLLEQACEQLLRWRGSELERVTIAVNASALQLKNLAFVHTVEQTLARYDLDGRQLELEITESTLMADPETILQTLQRLKMLRLSIAIDDFGTGYSSLGYLKRFPVDTVKIDRTFVRDMESDGNDRELIRAILAMSQSLGLGVIAEGVETEGQARILTEMGCPLLQGYLFAKPSDPESLLAFATSSRNDGDLNRPI
ncbi:EAL domain-containing protein [Marinobacterium sp. D7]|uniref:putative bifunctional diguanylate cyclase/phosphodiesterase n=1 Tax=Marinobacterium ramblicola TaxID=2849041 RepID=UPI001C2CF3C7|nr:EAL domain-containing protein [Marinobacterium ramblicola]MBV1787814.1 EAL domain-containing protein [Marinobacterium ramblicola]